MSIALDDHEVMLVEHSFARVEERVRHAVITFYTALLHARPHMQSVFQRHDHAQHAVAESFVTFVVTNLRSPSLVPLLEQMGRRGLLNGLTSADIDAIGQALLRTLREVEGEPFTTETAQAWALVYRWTISALRSRQSGSHEAQNESVTA